MKWWKRIEIYNGIRIQNSTKNEIKHEKIKSLVKKNKNKKYSY